MKPSISFKVGGRRLLRAFRVNFRVYRVFWFRVNFRVYRVFWFRVFRVEGSGIVAGRTAIKQDLSIANTEASRRQMENHSKTLEKKYRN